MKLEREKMVPRFLFSSAIRHSFCLNKKSMWCNRPFAQLLPGLETGHSVTVGQSPAHESHSEQSEKETRKTAFCSSETLKSYAGD